VPAAGTGTCCPAATKAAEKSGSCPKEAPGLVARLPSNLPKVAAPRPQTLKEEEDQETWPMTLRQAICTALDNGEFARVISRCPKPPTANCFAPSEDTDSYAGAIVISRLNPAVDPWRFKTEALAKVRSVEQQYWNLAQAHASLWAVDRAVSLAREVLDREEAELTAGRGTVADVAEASQRLEQFILDQVTRNSDVHTTEVALHQLLGLPPTDNRRIVPVTPPCAAAIELDWETCFREMSEQQPELVQKKLALGADPPMVLERGPARRIKFVRSPAQRRHEKVQQADLNQVIQQKTYTLVRMLLAVEGGYEAFQTAKRLRKAAAQRLDAQRAYYEEGRITIDRFLDAISQYATAVATESQYLMTYNISLAGLAEAKGTLLADDGIVIADSPRPAVAHTRPPAGTPKDDHQAKTASFEPDKSKSMIVPRIEMNQSCPVVTEAQDTCCQTQTETARTEVSAKPRSWTFSLSIGDAKPIQIKGTITAADADQPADANP
jgi:hypothetical protein